MPAARLILQNNRQTSREQEESSEALSESPTQSHLFQFGSEVSSYGNALPSDFVRRREPLIARRKNYAFLASLNLFERRLFGYSLAMPLEELSCKSQKNLMQRVAKACNERFRRTAPQPLKALFGFLFAPKRSPVLARLWRWVGREPFELKDLAHRSILFMSLLCWTCWMYPFNLALPWIAIAVRLSR